MSRKSLLIITVVLLLAAYLGWLGYLGLRAEEPRRAVVSIEMVDNGDYLMPHLNGWPYYNKPPLFNWAMILFFKLTGSYSEWVVRLPSMLALLALAYINWRITRKHIHPGAALFSSLILLTSADILFYGSVNTGEIDLFFSLLVYLDLILIFLFLEKKQFLPLFLLSYFFAALGLLTKGLPAVVFHGLTLVAALAWFREHKQLISWKHGAGILLFIVLAGGYAVMLHQRGELSGFLMRQVKESAQRTGIESNILETLKGLIGNPLTLLKISLPWSLAVLGLFSRALRRKVMANRLVAFSVVVVVVNFPVYWITGELRARYVYPLIPFLSILYAALIHEGIETSRWFRISLRAGTRFFVLLAAAALLVAFFIPSLKMAPSALLLNGFLVAGLLCLAYFNRKEKIPHFLALVMLMALLRIAMNNIYLPLYCEDSETTRFKAHVRDMVDLADGAPINMTGTPFRYSSVISLFGKEYRGLEIVVPMVLSYQVPYYYALETDKTIAYVENPLQGNYYLVKKQDLVLCPGELLYTYPDYSTKETWYLVRAGSD